MSERPATEPVSVGIAIGILVGALLGGLLAAVMSLSDGSVWVVLGVTIAAGAGFGLAVGACWAVIARKPQNTCPHCGYSTKGLPTTTCPECGKSIDDEPPKQLDLGP